MGEVKIKIQNVIVISLGVRSGGRYTKETITNMKLPNQVPIYNEFIDQKKGVIGEANNFVRMEDAIICDFVFNKQPPSRRIVPKLHIDLNDNGEVINCKILSFACIINL